MERQWESWSDPTALKTTEGKWQKVDFTPEEEAAQLPACGAKENGEISK
ncbi:hypothetical protein GCM10007922_13870 [Shewanella decolorationis]|nr:hypothetical protein GCM10007922_13870 [Shewanella decolorationis]